MGTDRALPHWQLESIFPSLESEAFRAAKRELHASVEGLQTFADTHGIGEGPPLVAEEVSDVLDALIGRLNDTYTLQKDIGTYLYGFISTNAFDQDARSEESALKPLESRLSTLGKRATAWLGRLDRSVGITASDLARAHAHWLDREVIDAGHLMSGPEEELTSTLTLTGGDAWSQLHGDLISRETIRVRLVEDESEYTVSELKNFQRHHDRDVRRRAYEAELDLLQRHGVAHAAAMNNIKGEVGELSRRRGWESPLDASLFEKSISRQSLEAMQEACRERFPVFRRYLRAKASFLGFDQLSWYDLLAPIGPEDATEFGWNEAKSFVFEQFGRYTDDLAHYAKRAFDSDWIDVPPRKGKRSGAFCMSIPGRRESRILLNYGGTLDDVFTLAHELGHGYHNHLRFQAGRTLLQTSTPSTLAETASIFCETIVTNAMLEKATGAEQLAILEQDLLSSTQLVVDIDSRFRFEQGVFEKRATRDLAIEELEGLMLEAQDQTYGSGLHPEERHAWMWAQKPHYYSAHSSFYNYPYTFGYLLGLGLYGEYQRDPEAFPDRYDAFLSSTGMADAATLAAGFGIDIEDVEFWRRGLVIVESRVERFEALVEEHL